MLTINVNEDVFIEGDETLRLSLDDFGHFYDLTITDTTVLCTFKYALTFDNESVAPPIVERYAFTLDNISMPGLQDPDPTTQIYAFTLNNESVTPSLVEKYALTFNNESVTPPIVEIYAFTLNNESVTPPIVEKYGLTFDNESVEPPAA